MRQALRNLFRKSKPVETNAQIVAVGSRPNRYIVRDVHGRRSEVGASKRWKLLRYVTIQNGRIVGDGYRFTKPQIYDV